MSNQTSGPAFTILAGAHKGTHKELPKDPAKIEACALEWVWVKYALKNGLDPIAGWTDHPACTDPVIADVVIAFNDRCGAGPDANARRLRVLGPLIDEGVLEGTAGSSGLSLQRRYMASDWALRSALPRLLRRTSLADLAASLEALNPVTDDATLSAARSLTYSIRDKARETRRAAWERFYAERAKLARVTAATTAAADATAAAAADATADAAAAATAAAAAEKILPGWGRIFSAALEARKVPGGNWNAAYLAARKMRDRILPRFAGLQDDLDEEFAGLLRRMCALREPGWLAKGPVARI